MYTKAFLDAVEDLKKEKKKKARERFLRKLTTTFFLILGFEVGFISYLTYPIVKSYFTHKEAPTLLASSQKDQGEVIAVASSTEPESENEAILACPVDFNFFEASFFSLCYPMRFKQIYQKNETLSGDLKEIVFSSDGEELAVSLDPERMWRMHLCNLSKKVEVAGYPAVRTTLKMEDAGGCNKIKGFTTKIDYLTDKSLYLSLVKLNGTYDDNRDFLLVEKSLRPMK